MTGSPLAEELLRAPTGAGNGRWYGVYSAVVASLDDPLDQARVKIMLPWTPDPGNVAWESWARLATLMGGGDRGSYFVPDVGDEVLVAFLGGDPSHPFVLGGLWNGADAPPVRMAAPHNHVKQLCSRTGVKVTLDDTPGSQRLELETPGGTHVVLKDAAGTEVHISDAGGNSVVLSSSGIAVTAAAQVTVQASTVDVTAATVDVKAGMSTFSGVVRCDTLIASSVVSATYTPGAGNIW